MSETSRRTVVVPDVVGLSFPEARDVGSRFGVVLANPDPDGPPIGAIAWEGHFRIVAQDPAPGVPALEYDSVRVTIEEDGEMLDDAGRDPREVPPVLVAGATPEAEAIVVDTGGAVEGIPGLRLQDSNLDRTAPKAVVLPLH